MVMRTRLLFSLTCMLLAGLILTGAFAKYALL